MLHPKNPRSRRLPRYVAALALTGLLFSQALPGAAAAPEAQKIEFQAERARVRLMVELASEPLATVEGLAQMARQVDLLKAEQQHLRLQLGKELIEHKVLSSHTKLFNGVAMEVKAADVARIAALPGVKQVHIARKFRMPEPQLASSLGMIGVPEVRGGGPGTPGVDGAGIKVAVIDTGIDYNHPDLGGCFGNGCRVIAGYDFVGEEFMKRPHRRGDGQMGRIEGQAYPLPFVNLRRL